MDSCKEISQKIITFWETSVFWGLSLELCEEISQKMTELLGNFSFLICKPYLFVSRKTIRPEETNVFCHLGLSTPINLLNKIHYSILFDTYGLCYGFGGRRFFRSVDWLSGASSSMAIPLGIVVGSVHSVCNFHWRQPAGFASVFITLSLLGVLDFALEQFQAFWLIFEDFILNLRYFELLKLAYGHPSV